MNLNNKTLFLPVEIMARELDSKLLIAHKALEKGFTVVIGTKGGVYKTARSYGSGIYLYKDHSLLSANMLDELGTLGLKIAVLDEEGLSWPSPEEYFSRRVNDKVFQVSDAIFAWGKKQYDIIVKTPSADVKKIHLVGNPRFDILNPKYIKYIEDQAKHNLSIFEEDYVLINSMFTPGNWNPLLYGTPSYVEHMRIRGLIQNEEQLNFYTKVSESAAELFDIYVSLLKNLSKKFPKTKFIIRPHPDENQEKWHELFVKEKNVFVENKGSAIYWILKSKVVIYTGCTTAIEAWAMNKPTLRYHPIPETKFGPFLPNQFGNTIKTETELFKELELILDSSEDIRFDVDPDYVESFIKNAYTADAAEKIINVLDSFYNGDNLINRSSFKQLKKRIKVLLLFDIKKRWGSRIVSKLKRTLKQKDVEKDLKTTQAKSQKFPELEREDIENRLLSLDKINGKNKKQKWDIVKLESKTFKIDNPKTKL
jgi:surface carbohydrate biosynthesis protein